MTGSVPRVQAEGMAGTEVGLPEVEGLGLMCSVAPRALD